MTDTKIALGLLKHQKSIKMLLRKFVVKRQQKLGTCIINVFCASSLTCRSNMQQVQEMSIMIDVCKPF